MSDIYDEYFKDNDTARGENKVMGDIKDRKLKGRRLSRMLDALENKGHFHEKAFEKTQRSSWDDEYLKKLSRRHISGYFSRKFLVYFADVSRYVYFIRLKKTLKRPLLVLGYIAAIAAVIVIVVTIIRWLTGGTQ